MLGELPIVEVPVNTGTLPAVPLPVTVCAAAPADANAKPKPSQAKYTDFLIVPPSFRFRSLLFALLGRVSFSTCDRRRREQLELFRVLPQTKIVEVDCSECADVQFLIQ